MATKTTDVARRDILNVRVKAADRTLIERAAALVGKSRTDFLLDAGRRAAENALLDQTLIQAGPEAMRTFIERLDAPPRANAKLVLTLNTRAPWD